MTTGLLTQLDEFYSQIDAAQDPIDPDEVQALIDRPVRQLAVPGPPRVHRKWPVAIGAAAAVLLLIGGAGLLARSGGSAPPVSATNQIDSVSSLTWGRVPHDEAVFGGPSGQAMFDVTVGGPGLVAVGESGPDAAVWTSQDGITWSRVPDDEQVFGGRFSQVMSSLTVGGPGLVAVGSDGPVYDMSAAVWTSADGISWSRVPHDEGAFGGAYMTEVTPGGPGLVAAGFDGNPQTADGKKVMWTSADGLTWLRIAFDESLLTQPEDVAVLPVTATIADVIGVGDGRVAVGVDWRTSQGDNDAAVWTSEDGVQWTRIPHDDDVFGGQPAAAMASAVVVGEVLVVVGEAGPEEDYHAAVWIARVED